MAPRGYSSLNLKGSSLRIIAGLVLSLPEIIMSCITNKRLVSETVATPLVEYTTELSLALIWQIELLPNSITPKQVNTYLKFRLNGINSIVIRPGLVYKI